MRIPSRIRRRAARAVRGFLALITSLALTGATGGAARPNVVLIMCDDMGWSDLGCYGGEIDTPNLDRLARDGMRFTQFYNNAKCTTTRASVITGLYPRGAGDRITKSMVTLGEAMKAAGYQTILTGKWHLGSTPPHRPIDRGFDEYYGLMDGCCNYFDPAQPDPPYKGGRIRVFGHNDRLITEFPAGFYATDAFTDHAIEAVTRCAERDAPFLLHLCYTAPHYPLHAKPEDIAKYRGTYEDVGWNELRKRRHARQLALGLVDPRWPLSGEDGRAYDWSTADHDWEDHRMAVYAAMIDRLDQGIGRLLDALDALGIADDTAVLFLSDNGGCAEEPGGRRPPPGGTGTADTYTAVGPAWGWAQNAPFRRYKSWVHEGGISTPLIVRWPGVVEPGSITHQVAHVIDFLPTFLELAGATHPETDGNESILPAEGKSIVPILRGDRREGHDALFWEWSGNGAVREGKWKLVWDKLTRRPELYDLDADRTETNDVSRVHPERVERMTARYEAWAGRTGRRVPWR